ncbi:MAG: D-alanyl-D-alanine carboxypeptidase, partial [Firmicutes bacterium]|nr:D-alanyl-D-alanine carboxypeptidase [Bacillota bacterium]
ADEAKHCLSASALRDGTRLIATVIGAPDSKVRFAAVSQMFNYGFANFKNVKIIDSNKSLDPLTVRKGKQPTIELKYENDFYIFTKIGDEKNYKEEFNLPEAVSAPINEDTVVGKSYIVKDGKVVGEVNILTASSVNKKSYFDYIYDVIHEW